MENLMSKKKLLLKPVPSLVENGTMPSTVESHSVSAFLIEISQEQAYKKIARQSQDEATSLQQEEQNDADVDSISNQIQTVHRVCLLLLRTFALIFFTAIVIAILQKLLF